MRLDLRSQTEWYSFYSGQYDDACIALVRELLAQIEGDFLDVGGNIGMYAVRTATLLGESRRSLCFEPMPNNAARILENAHQNNCKGQVEIHQIALSDTEGETTLVLREDFQMVSKTGNASIAISEEADAHFLKIKVHTRRFDDFLAEQGSAKFPVAKVDIEGHEDFFLRGAAAWLHRDRPIIFTEINNWFYQKRGTTSSAVFASSLPKDYQIALFKFWGTSCVLEPFRIDELTGLQSVETCLLYPPERWDELCRAMEGMYVHA
jgi:FkbM family methyltransferase